ncbi:MAG: hypothetical protein JNG89_21055 [Planctomycetaceae bacterium]|nr:hypothetical protein [Planctomycetaceae bacterium]
MDARVTPDFDGSAICRALVVAAGLMIVVATRAIADDEPHPTDGTRRAIAFLANEVPDWPQQNRCFSCHNNGDGARALLVARLRGWDVPDDSLTETRNWLLHPEQWETTGGNPDYGDRRLVNVQFSGALAALADSEFAATASLLHAAKVLADLQFDDGSWAFEAEGQIGSPVGYGRALMTVTTRNILIQADRAQFAANIAAAENWLRRAEPRTVLDAAAVLWGLAGADDAEAQVSIADRLELIRGAQSDRGGWGPYRIGAPEPFDTAVVVLALQQLPATADTRQLIARGREFLLATQLPGGSWPATTRPPGQESYPQMISTTAWAALALIMSEPPIQPAGE